MRCSVASSDDPVGAGAAATDEDNETDRSGERSPVPCLELEERGVTCFGESSGVPFAEHSIICLRTIFS
jgi:hypothetical protein